MDPAPLSGAWVPILTPLAEDGSLDLDAVQPCVDRLIAAGVDGIVALGTTGEWADLTAAEHDAVAEAVVAAARRRVPVLVGAGSAGTAGAAERAAAAAAAGADGVLVLPPLYWKPDVDGLVAHFAAVADAADLPVLLYDFPALAGTALTPAAVARIVQEVPSVTGIKLSGPELRLVHGVRAAVPDPGFRIFVGAADLVVPALLSGAADGAILAIGNVVPELVVEAIRAGRFDHHAALARAHRGILAALAIPALTAPSILALKAGAAARGAPIRPVVRTAPNAVPDAVERAATIAGEL